MTSSRSLDLDDLVISAAEHRVRHTCSTLAVAFARWSAATWSTFLRHQAFNLGAGVPRSQQPSALTVSFQLRVLELDRRDHFG